MELTSLNFENQSEIPKKHTCDGDDISPALQWTDVPEGTKSLALIVDDPTRQDLATNPKMTWVHWVICTSRRKRPPLLKTRQPGICPMAR
ncbi:MAG: hypothetical protein R2875_09785 [Desulfobacterales bacterium]